MTIRSCFRIGPLRAPHARTGSTCLGPALVVLLMLLPVRAHAQHAQLRLFTSDDGFPESWITELARGPSGRIWTSHGVPGLGSFDGYKVRTTPVGERLVGITEGPDSVLWALLTDPARRRCLGVQTLDLSGWTRYPVRELDGLPVGDVRLLAWAEGRVLILTPSRIIEFDAETTSTRLVADAAAFNAGTFNALQPAAGGGAWVSATHTLLRLGRPAASGVSAPTEVRLPPTLQDAVWTSDLGDMLLSVVHHPGDPAGVLVRHQADGWSALATGTAEQPLAAAWADPAGSVWILRASSSAFTVSVMEDGRPEVQLSRRRALAGMLNAIQPVPDGSFWLGTSIGLVRFQPRVWRRPPALADREAQTASMLEAMNGDIYAVQKDALVRRTRQGWRVYPYPPGHRANAHYSRVLASLADGRIVVGAVGPSVPLVFDPASGGFEPLRHPEGRSVEILGTQVPSGVWTITRQGDRPARIESYDGRSFHVRAELDTAWSGDNRPRHILETRGGDLFITPTPKGIARVHRREVSWLPSSEVPDARPFVAAELPDGTIWFGGREGVLAFNGNELVKVREHLQTVRSIIVSRDGSIWIASNSGVHRFADGQWVTLTNAEGLPNAAAFDLLETRDGHMWVSTSSGLSQRYADADVDAPETLLPADANPAEVPPRGDVRFVFQADDRWSSTPRGRLLYSYRLDDRPWSAFSVERAVSLTGLASGRHQLAVRAMDRNWNIDATPATMTFSVMLPWYREPGVMALGLVTMLALGVAVSMAATRQRRLEHEVLERTEALRTELAERRRIQAERAELEEQLRHSQKMDAIGRLAGGISHDFNNLLTVIGSYADELLERIDRTDPRVEAAREIAKAAERAASLTRQLLSFSRQQPIEREVLDVNAVLGDLHRMLSRLLGERIDLRFGPGIGLWPVLADRGQMEQVVVNLVLNARDAMPDGGRLTLETANVDLDEAYVRQRVDASPGPHVRLTVIDTGTGMDENMRDRLFEPFFTTKPVGRGAGLGLAIVYGIIRQNDGHIVVTSEPGRGSRFDVYLPRTQASVVRAAQRLPAPASTVTGTVLLVEDEEPVRRLARTALERDGHRVIQAATGEEALALVERERLRPDLVVTDVVMPGIDGRQLAARLREQRPGMPVLLISGYAAPDRPDRDSDTVTRFLQKPFTPSALADAAQQLLGAAQC